ncbi:MAG TPA: histidine kinase dimerization/phospho-acceptor domain-containing protein [Bacteroidota bacterium]|nr:histidine kinase dimerization/phospho-acceptor domain-containing protein [Bacteroidota bacterium]
MKSLRQLYTTMKEFFIKYPAVLSGYIIYAYFFVSTMEFYRDFKQHSYEHGFDFVKEFDALLWMWLLASALVKVIEFRSKLGEQEKKQLEQQKELEIQQSQLKTMHEVVRGLQHDINNPLTIILAYLRRAEKAAENNAEVIKNLNEVREGAERIAKALRDYSEAKGVATVSSPVGGYAQPRKPDDTSRTMDEASPQGS